MKLYDLELSGNCYKVRLLLSLLDVTYEIVPVDFMGGEHKVEPFLTKNPFAEIPVLEDGNVVLRDSQAILVYIARAYGSEDWLPTEAADMARVMQWLSTAANEVARGPNDARLHDKFGYNLDLAKARDRADAILRLLDRHLSSRDWLELGRPTLADIACFPYIALAPEGGVSLDTYPAVREWIGRVKSLRGFEPMPGI